MNIIALGAPGVGKGTYTTLMSGEFGFPHISTGDMFRENIKAGTPVGKKAKEYMDRGELVPDAIVIDMLKGRLKEKDAAKGFILDGFPRTIPQADALKAAARIDVVLNFTAPEATILERLSGRRICRKCGEIYHVKNIRPKVEGVCDKCGGELYQRDDDKEAVIKSRLKEYEAKTAPLIGYYEKLGLLKDIDVSTPISESAKVMLAIKRMLKL